MVSNHEKKAPNSDFRDTYFKICILVLFFVDLEISAGIDRLIFTILYTEIGTVRLMKSII